MTSDDDGGRKSTVPSSGFGAGGCPSPMPGAGGCPSPMPGARTVANKGILVHNNKKSANTNRVSFVTSSSSTVSSCGSLSPTPVPSSLAKRSKNNQHQQRRTVNEGDDVLQIPYHARTGRRLTGFGVKSYLHEFYDDPDGNQSFQDDNDDDFKYCVEPATHWYRHCSGVYAVLGLVVIALGATVMAAGHLIPTKDPVVGRSTNMEVIDPRAVSFNDHLASCRYVGSVVFAVGVVFTVIRFWASVIRGVGRDGGPDWAAKKLQTGEERSSSPEMQLRGAETVRIPIMGTLENVQPDPGSIRLQSGDSS